MFDFSIEKQCVYCGSKETIRCYKKDYNKWKSGKCFIQDALPYVSDDQREILISGTCGKCFDNMFNNNEEENE